MADFEEQDFDGGSDPADGRGAAPRIHRGVLDPRTFPRPWPPAVTDAPPIQPQAPTIGPLDTDVRAEVLRDIQDAQAKLPPIGTDLSGLDDRSLAQVISAATGQPFPAHRSSPVTEGPSLERPAAAITGPLMTDPHAEVFQNFLNAQAGLPPVRPHPETWSINGQPYLAISARTFDPARSNGVTSMPTPEESAAAVTGMSKIAVRRGGPERVGFISGAPSRVVTAQGRAGGGNDADTFTLDRPAGRPVIHGHIDDESDGMVDDPPAYKGYGDTWPFNLNPPAPNATVSHGRVGWHVMDHGLLKFLYPPGSMDSFQIGKMQRNLDDEQSKFLRPK